MKNKTSAILGVVMLTVLYGIMSPYAFFLSMVSIYGFMDKPSFSDVILGLGVLSSFVFSYYGLLVLIIRHNLEENKSPKLMNTFKKIFTILVCLFIGYSALVLWNQYDINRIHWTEEGKIVHKELKNLSNGFEFRKEETHYYFKSNKFIIEIFKEEKDRPLTKEDIEYLDYHLKEIGINQFGVYIQGYNENEDLYLEYENREISNCISKKDVQKDNKDSICSSYVEDNNWKETIDIVYKNYQLEKSEFFNSIEIYKFDFESSQTDTVKMLEEFEQGITNFAVLNVSMEENMELRHVADIVRFLNNAYENSYSKDDEVSYIVNMSSRDNEKLTLSVQLSKHSQEMDYPTLLPVECNTDFCIDAPDGFPAFNDNIMLY